MAGAGVIATQLTDRSARAYTLTVGGVDVLGLNGSSYKVDRETIRVVEQGPGGVSSMDFDVADPLLAWSPNDMDEVEFWDQTNDRPLFAGFVQSYDPIPQGVGRRWRIRCVGIEAVLDWMIVPSFSAAAGEVVSDAVQRAYGSAEGIGVGLRHFVEPGNSGNGGSQAYPVASGRLIGPRTVEVYEAVSTEGQTLRETLRAILDYALFDDDFFSSTSTARMIATVDFYHGLRVWLADGDPDDYATMTVNESTNTISALSHTVDAGGVVRQVYVDGGNAAGSGIVGGGTGKPGPTAVISDSNITTASAKEAAGLAYLFHQRVGVRGEMAVPYSEIPSTNIRAGSFVTITSTPAAQSAVQYVITQVSKVFLAGGRQQWTVAYGQLPPNAMRQLRRLTRTVRS